MMQVDFIWKGRTLCNRVYDLNDHIVVLRAAREIQEHLAVAMSKVSRAENKRAKPIPSSDIELHVKQYSPQIEMELPPCLQKK